MCNICITFVMPPMVSSKQPVIQNSGARKTKRSKSTENERRRPGLLLQTVLQLCHLRRFSCFSSLLLFALGLDLLGDKFLITLQAGLNVHLELDNVIEHAFKLGVQLLAECA